MTLQVKTSALTIAPEEFARRVEAYASAMREYEVHLEGVRVDAVNESLKPDERRVAFPPPYADPLIEAAVREGYEFAGPTLTEKKAALTARVREMEAEACQAIIPPAKARYFHLREQEIFAKQVRTHTDASPEDTAFMDDLRAKKARMLAVQRWGAKLEHDIDDLTELTIDQFVIEPFHG